jgi:hypothetical protein
MQFAFVFINLWIKWRRGSTTCVIFLASKHCSKLSSHFVVSGNNAARLNLKGSYETLGDCAHSPRWSRNQRFYGLLISLTEIRACLKLAEQWPATVRCPSCWHVKEMMINEPSLWAHCSPVTIAYPVFCFEYIGTKGISRIHGSCLACSSVWNIRNLPST